MRRLLLLLVGGLLAAFLAGPVLAADGAACGSDNFAVGTDTSSPIFRGPWRPIWCIVLCDDDTAASGSCSDFNFTTAGSPAGSIGLADLISFEIGSDNDCTAGTITLTTTQVSGGQSHNIGGEYQLDLAGVGNTRITNAVNIGAPLGAIIEVDFAGVAGCTGGFDIIMIGYEEIRP